MWLFRLPLSDLRGIPAVRRSATGEIGLPTSEQSPGDGEQPPPAATGHPADHCEARTGRQVSERREQVMVLVHGFGPPEILCAGSRAGACGAAGSASRYGLAGCALRRA